MPEVAVAYREIRIPKRSGGWRVIHAPAPDLKKKQKQILRYLTALAIPAGPFIHAYVRRRSIKTAALALQPVGRAPPYMIKCDIENFFPSVRKEDVLDACRYNKVPDFACAEIEKYCFLNGHLPQGAPTSPFLSNLVMKKVGARMWGAINTFSKTRTYVPKMSFYCDNIVMTGEEPGVRALLPRLRNILADFGLRLNPGKTKIIGPGGRKETCGVVVSEKLSVRRNYWRTLRAMIFNSIRDTRSELTRPGFYIEPNARVKLLERAPVCVEECRRVSVRVPLSEWKGRAEFVNSINPVKGLMLLDLLSRLEDTWKQSEST